MNTTCITGITTTSNNNNNNNNQSVVTVVGSSGGKRKITPAAANPNYTNAYNVLNVTHNHSSLLRPSRSC
jgi:hypothetical protein